MTFDELRSDIKEQQKLFMFCMSLNRGFFPVHLKRSLVVKSRALSILFSREAPRFVQNLFVGMF